MATIKIKCVYCNKRYTGGQDQLDAIIACPKCKQAGDWWIRIPGPDDTQPLTAEPALQPAGPPPAPHSTPQQQAQFSTPQQMYSGYHPTYSQSKQRISGIKIALIIGVAIFGMLFIGGVLVGVLAVATTPKLTEAKNRLEVKQVGDLHSSLWSIMGDEEKRNRLKEQGYQGVGGHRLWAKLIEDNIVDAGLVPNLVSLNSSTDKTAADPSSITLDNCSYTLPKGDQLFEAMRLRGRNRCILITFNSRNWNNYPHQGVVAQWSDGATPFFFSFEDAHESYGITKQEWADPAGKLFGKKPPFQYTFE